MRVQCCGHTNLPELVLNVIDLYSTQLINTKTEFSDLGKQTLLLPHQRTASPIKSFWKLEAPEEWMLLIQPGLFLQLWILVST